MKLPNICEPFESYRVACERLRVFNRLLLRAPKAVIPSLNRRISLLTYYVEAYCNGA